MTAKRIEELIPIQKMTTKQKLQAIDLIWNDLLRNPEAVPSPEWHAAELAARETRVREGSSTYSAIHDVKERLRKRTE